MKWTHLVISALDEVMAEKARLTKKVVPCIGLEAWCRNAHDAEICRAAFQASEHYDRVYAVITLENPPDMPSFLT